MIEVIYKDESQEGQNGEEPFGLPRNIRQIGLAAEDYRIYMEDYVYTFLVRLARAEDSLGEAKTRVAVLTGNLKWRSQTAYLFIKGAIIAEEMEAAPDHIDFSENQWKQIQEAQKEYFEDQEIVGWFFSQPQLLLKVSEVMSKVHMKHFGGEKVLMLMEPQEREDAFFRYENNEMVRLGGYYLYYEKNPGMQTYMIDKNEELQPEPQEKYEDQAVKDFRKIIADKKETRKEPAAPSVFSYGLTACLAIAVLTVGVNFYRSYQNVKQNEKESATVSSVIVEEITPSPVVGTSNNEAVRQHKQYRTDTIQNDAGKNKKNNEENDEENNQSTSEKENSEKKNNTSEKKISAEQTDTEQKSDKTEQLPDVKTEKADKTEQIYQQEADERKAQKRVREAVQKENSEAAGKAHESYVIQPGDTLFQNIYTAERTNGMISIASSFPGSIKAFEITPGNEIILQKSAFLASEAGVELSMHFRKKLGSGLFGGEGFILQKLSGNGIAFAEFDGHVIEYELQPGQQIVIDTGHLAAMSVTCQTIPGIKNMFLGSEGLFNTVVTGPGHVWLQTMPISNMAGALIPYLPTTNK